MTQGTQDEFAQLEAWHSIQCRRYEIKASSTGRHIVMLDGTDERFQAVLVEASKRKGSAITAKDKTVFVPVGTPIRECIRLALDHWWMLYGED